MSVDLPVAGASRGERGRGAPTRSVAQKMSAGQSAEAVALAGCVQELVRERFPTRPWIQLAAQLNSDERKLLGGGEDRELSRKLSAQFGSKAPRQGPGAAVILMVLQHCLPALAEPERAHRRAEIEQRFRDVHGSAAALEAQVVPRPRRAGVAVQLQQQRAENAALREELARERDTSTQLQAELKAVTARVAALEAERAATALAQPRTVGIRAEPGDLSAEGTALVRPFMLAHEQRANAGPTITGGTRQPPAGPPAPGGPLPADGTPETGETGGDGETPTVATAPDMYRLANRPRGFRPLPQYRPELQDSAPVLPLVMPSQRVVARVVMPPEIKIPAPRRSPSPPGWEGGATTALPLYEQPLQVEDAGSAERERCRQRARVEAARIVTELHTAWAAPWADLAPDRLTDDARGWAQLPLLATAFALAALVSTVPALVVT